MREYLPSITMKEATMKEDHSERDRLTGGVKVTFLQVFLFSFFEIVNLVLC